ncbi:hypothetical protein EYF80_023904 [Liparis tanakae]|uniref:Uncharacterized protein n=1 Tax=Liparis tanakae TaxID=230148 RepID=A0A4Z2HLT5_9TELE|nr:hypothetical protein EYF80_023904 [Liparis tanakae]
MTESSFDSQPTYRRGDPCRTGLTKRLILEVCSINSQMQNGGQEGSRGKAEVKITFGEINIKTWHLEHLWSFNFDIAFWPFNNQWAKMPQLFLKGVQTPHQVGENQNQGCAGRTVGPCCTQLCVYWGGSPSACLDGWIVSVDVMPVRPLPLVTSQPVAPLTEASGLARAHGISRRDPSSCLIGPKGKSNAPI